MTKPSPVELAKQNSCGLRGNLLATLHNASTHFDDQDQQLLKFHGVYQQDDRDSRQSRRRQGLDRHYQFMVRCAIPAGRLTADQYLQLDHIADQYAGGALRITARQSIQFHGVLKSNVQPTISKVNAALLTTLAACGDVPRNIMASAAPLATPLHRQVLTVVDQLAVALRPKTGAYHEIWLDGIQQTQTSNDEEPFFHTTYLPRKLKLGVAMAEDNSIDLYSYDVGLAGLHDGGRLLGFNLLVGGGLGMSHGRPDSFAQLAQPLAWVAAENAVEAVKCVVAIFRDFGNRSDRKHARLKYLIHERGLPWMVEQLRSRAGFRIESPRPMPQSEYDDYLGARPQGDGKWWYGLFVEGGRIRDTSQRRLKTAIHQIVARNRPQVIFTPQQNLLFAGLDPEELDSLVDLLSREGITTVESLSGARRHAMACPALPTCGLALAESERVLPSVIHRFETLLDSLGIAGTDIAIRMTGCPNGCARPYTADIALVGRRPGVYHVYVGGRLRADRLGDLFAADVSVDQVVEVLKPLLVEWSLQRYPNEGLGDYYQRRLGSSQPRVRLTGKEQESRLRFLPADYGELHQS